MRICNAGAPPPPYSMDASCATPSEAAAAASGGCDDGDAWNCWRFRCCASEICIFELCAARHCHLCGAYIIVWWATTGSLVGHLAAVADTGCRRTLFAASDMDAETSFLVGLGGVISASFLEGSRKVVAAGGVRAGSKTPVRDHLGAPVDLLRICTPLQPGLSFLREVRGGHLAFHSAALRLIANSAMRQIFPTSAAPTVSGLIAVTKLSSWSGKEALSHAYFDGLRLSLSGAAVLLDGSGMHVHDSLRIFAADDTSDDVAFLRAEGPRIRAADPQSSPVTRRHSIVSLVALKNDAKAFVVGRIMQKFCPSPRLT